MKEVCIEKELSIKFMYAMKEYLNWGNKPRIDWFLRSFLTLNSKTINTVFLKSGLNSLEKKERNIILFYMLSNFLNKDYDWFNSNKQKKCYINLNDFYENYKSKKGRKLAKSMGILMANGIRRIKTEQDSWLRKKIEEKVG